MMCWVFLAAGLSGAMPDSDRPPPTTPGTPPPSERATIDGGAGVGVASRHFAYRDPIGGNARPYDVDGVTMVLVREELYPFARNEGALGDVGLVGDYAQAFGLTSATNAGAPMDTSWMQLDGGVRVRLRPARRLELGLSVVYGRETFSFGATGAPAASLASELPAVAYEHVRPTLDVRAPLGPFALRARVGWMQVLDGGDVANRMRGASVAGVDAAAGVGLRVAGPLEARLGATYERFFYAFDPVPGDRFVAGGALDQILRGELVLALAL